MDMAITKLTVAENDTGRWFVVDADLLRGGTFETYGSEHGNPSKEAAEYEMEQFIKRYPDDYTK